MSNQKNLSDLEFLKISELSILGKFICKSDCQCGTFKTVNFVAWHIKAIDVFLTSDSFDHENY